VGSDCFWPVRCPGYRNCFGRCGTAAICCYIFVLFLFLKSFIAWWIVTRVLMVRFMCILTFFFLILHILHVWSDGNNFLKIKHSVLPETSCLHYLLPDKRDVSITGRLCHARTLEPLKSRTVKFHHSFIPYSLHHYV